LSLCQPSRRQGIARPTLEALASRQSNRTYTCKYYIYATWWITCNFICSSN